MIKLILIHLADAIDNYILGHRFYKICDLIGGSNWWGDHIHNCFYCKNLGTDSSWLKEEKDK